MSSAPLPMLGVGPYLTVRDLPIFLRNWHVPSAFANHVFANPMADDVDPKTSRELWFRKPMGYFMSLEKIYVQ